MLLNTIHYADGRKWNDQAATEHFYDLRAEHKNRGDSDDDM